MRSQFVALALTLAACSGAGDAAPAPAPTTVRCPSFATDCEEVLPPDTVELRGVRFRPDRLEVSAGATVTFENLDPVRHTVVGGGPDDPKPDLVDLVLAARGDRATVTFDVPGAYAYFCDVHPGAMQATIVVR